MDKERLHFSLALYFKAQSIGNHTLIVLCAQSIRGETTFASTRNAMTKWYEPVVLSLCPLSKKAQL